MEMTFGQVVHEYRKKKGLTQHELAHLCNVGQSMISMIEKDQTGVSLELYSLLVELLGIEPSIVFTLARRKRAYAYIPYLEKADEATLTVVRRVLGMPEQI